jgi:hypothetical protein
MQVDFANANGMEEWNDFIQIGDVAVGHGVVHADPQSCLSVKTDGLDDALERIVRPCRIIGLGIRDVDAKRPRFIQSSSERELLVT